VDDDTMPKKVKHRSALEVSRWREPGLYAVGGVSGPTSPLF